MKKCVILSMDNLEGYEVSDNLLESPLVKAGWKVSTISWRAEDVNWNDYALVMIRSTWDYQLNSEAFLSVLEQIQNSEAHLDNPLHIVRWNIDKRYLRELSKGGVEILPTLWEKLLTPDSLDSYFSQLGCEEIVIKPCVSAGAFDTYRLTKKDAPKLLNELTKKFSERNFMVQPFAQAIVEEGEFSLFFFDGVYSHCIIKTPKANDFRVQEEFGGRLVKVEPEEKLLAQAEKTLSAIGEILLYARLDFVRTSSGFALMEAELIEPSLYLNLDSESPQRYVDALQTRMKRLGVIETSTDA